MHLIRKMIPGPATMILLLAFATSVITLPGLAQEPPPPEPVRDSDREAPEREPVVLEQTATPDGVNITLAIPAVADAYIASERPFENFGNESLFLGYNLAGDTNFGAERLLLQFDVEGSIPAGAVIHSASLELRLLFSSPVDDDPMGTVLRRLASPWAENLVTWNTEPTWTPVDDTTFVGSAQAWYVWDITGTVQEWMAGLYPNYGVEIIGDEAVQQRERAFYSRETSSTYYPQLIVDYTISDDTEPPQVTVDALPDYSWRSFTVSWSGSDVGGAGITAYDVQVRVDGGGWQDWLIGVSGTEAEYAGGVNGRLYEFRARGIDAVGNVEPFGAAEAATTVDSQAPTSTIDFLPILTNSDSFTVSWSGNDQVSGIQYYDVQYRFNNDPWVTWLPQTLATSADMIAAPDGVYSFEVRAVDNADRVELFTDSAEETIIVDNDAPFITPQIWLPIILQNQ